MRERISHVAYPLSSICFRLLTRAVQERAASRPVSVSAPSNASEPVAAAVYQTASFAQIIGRECGADLLFVSLQEAGEQSRGDAGIVGEIRIVDELMAQADGRAVQCVVGIGR